VNNNQYAYSTPNRLEMPVPTIAERAAAYGMPGIRVDGQDVLEVYRVAHDAVERARSGGGPSLIESVSLRWRGHAGHDPAKYVPRELLDDYVEHRDPVKRYRQLLVEKGVVDEAEIQRVLERVEQDFQAGYEFAQSSPFPVGDDVTRGLWVEDGYWRSEPSREGGTG
jgi:pyruvate dehydrogenase E1 component alpha subunit